MQPTDTICALATAPGEGGIAIVRVSGPRAEEMLNRLIVPIQLWESHKMYYGHAVYNGETLDECMTVLFRAPRSYTREDVAEIHLHGGSWAAKSVLEALFALGFGRVICGYFDGNEASRRVMEKSGMKPTKEEAVISYRGVDHRCLFCEITHE